MTAVYVVSVLRVLITMGVLFGFPWIAVWSLRHGGRRGLTMAVVAAAAIILAFALMAASHTFGNARPATVTYAHTAIASALVFGVAFGMPVLASAAAVVLLGRDKLPFWAVYAATVGAAACGWIAGTIGGFWIVPMFS